MKTCLVKSRLFVFLSVPILFVSIFLAALGQAEDIAKYPSRPITYFQPFPAGTSGDLGIRLMCKAAGDILGQPIVIVNKPGASGSLGINAIATAKPDGYTVGNTPMSPMLTQPLLEKVPYHPIKDLRMIIQWAGFNHGLVVRADAPFKGFKDIIAYARQNPGKVTYGTAGAQSMGYITMKQIAKKENVQMVHIPYKGTTEAETDLLGGNLTFALGGFMYPQIEAGRTRLLFLLKDEPSAEYPQTPILKDLGYDFPYPAFYTVAGPKGLPEGIVKKLEAAFTKAIKDPAFVKGMKELRLPIVYRNSKELSAYMASRYDYFTKYFKETNLNE